MSDTTQPVEVRVRLTGDAATPTEVGPPADHLLSGMVRDGGVSTQLSDGSVLWFFGDTFELAPNGGLRYFVHNTAAWAPADSPTTTVDAIAGSVPVVFAEPPTDWCEDPAFPEPALWPDAAVVVPAAGGTDQVVVFLGQYCLGPGVLDIEMHGMAVAELFLRSG